MPEAVRRRVAEIGTAFSPDILHETAELYSSLVVPPSPKVRSTLDIAYGQHSRQQLDIYSSAGSDQPIVLLVPGGGFVAGDKRAGEPFFRNVAGFFAERGIVGVAMNYRLAPEHQWPSGSEDVAGAVEWLYANAKEYGGDPSRIFLFGQSAGATHVATYLFDPVIAPKRGVAGAILVSGLYDIADAPMEPNILAYYGSDRSRFTLRSPLTHVNQSTVPLFLAIAEFDPLFLATPTLDLAKAVARRGGKTPPLLWMADHNHVSTVFSFGTGDNELGDRIVAFVGTAGQHT